jgi:hypothetical protein
MIVNRRVLSVSPDGLARIEEIERKIPRPRQVKVAGELDQIRYSDKVFILALPTGERVRGLAEGITPHDLKSLWGTQVVVGGCAFFRPSGALARIEASQITPASERDVGVWSAMPKPLGQTLDVRELSKPQGPRSGINAIIGKWPGDESDDAVDEALGSLS